MEYDKLVNTNNKIIICTCHKNYTSLQFGILTTSCKAQSHKCFCDKLVDTLCFMDCSNCDHHICICKKLFFPSGKIKLCKSSLHDCICDITPIFDSKNMCRSEHKIS